MRAVVFTFIASSLSIGCGAPRGLGSEDSGGSGTGESGAETGDGTSSESAETGDEGMACVPGQSVGCTCIDGQEGAQVCADDGDSYLPCECSGGETTGTETGEPGDCLPPDEVWPGDYEINANDDIPGIAGFTAIAGSLKIEGTAVTSLEGLECLEFIGNQIYLADTTLLKNLAGLDSVTTMQGELEVYGNLGLTSFDGLGALTGAGWVSIGQNNNLTDLAALSSLKSVDGGFGIENNPKLLQCDAFALADQLDSIGDTVCITGNKPDACPDSCG